MLMLLPTVPGGALAYFDMFDSCTHEAAFGACPNASEALAEPIGVRRSLMLDHHLLSK